MPLFTVHEHHARNLHFDLRLESDGVLKSWAVPKGPSLDPRDRRLAVAVADHPLDYAGFEGRIPEGQYGAGAVAVWDTGTYDAVEGSLEEGRAVLVFRGSVMKGGFSFFCLSSRPGQWLLVKRRDESAVSGFRPKLVLGA